MPYKEAFIKNGVRNLKTTEESVEELWQQVESFSEYGFNKSVPMYTKVACPGGVKEIGLFNPGETVFCINEDGNTVETEVVKVHDHGTLDAYEVTFDDGSTVECSINHKFLTEKGQISLREILETRSSIMCDQHIGEKYGKEKNRGVENQLRCCFPQQTSVARTQKKLPAMQKFDPEGKIGEVETCGSLRSEMFNYSEVSRTSQEVFEMRRFGLENSQRSESLRSSMRTNIQAAKVTRRTFEELRKVQQDKKRKHSNQNGEVEQGQRASRQKENIFRNSQEDFSQTGNSSSTCSTIKEVENRESRKVFEMHRSSVEESQAISNGNMASQQIGLGNAKNSLWRATKTSRFCERQSLDRSRWILPFLRTSEQRTKSISSTSCPTAGRNVEEGSNTSKRYHVNSNRHDMLQEQFGGDARGVVQIDAGHASISDTGRLVSRRVVGVRHVGKRRMCDLEVANPTHNFLLSNGVVTSNSHSCAYSYISSRLLWLKAHYPMEFYCVTLSIESTIDKVKGYMNDAKGHDIIIQPIDINRSGVDFDIQDDEIYYGLSKVKGIGAEVSKKIAENAPYEGFVDFMNRFGTEARVIQPLIALGAFKDAPKGELHKFYEVYKDTARKRRDRTKRNEATMERHRLALNEVAGDEIGLQIWASWVPEEEVKPLCKDSLYGQLLDGDVPAIEKVWKKWKRSVEGFIKKEKISDEDGSLSLGAFNPDQHYLGTEFEEVYAHSEKGEELYYGFKWTHPIEKSDDYTGKTFEAFNQDQQDGGTIAVGAVQVLVLHYKEKTSKNNNTYHQLEVEDSNSHFVRINVWKDDHAAYGDQEFIEGNMLQLQVAPPQGSFRTFTMARSGKKNNYGKYVPIPKDQDHRVIVMHKPEAEEVMAPVERTFADVGLIEID